MTRRTAVRRTRLGSISRRDYEVAYWTKKFCVTKAALEAAVGKIGVSADAVAKEFGKARA
jgi:hypothetical protein